MIFLNGKLFTRAWHGLHSSLLNYDMWRITWLMRSKLQDFFFFWGIKIAR